MIPGTSAPGALIGVIQRGRPLWAAPWVNGGGAGFANPVNAYRGTPFRQWHQRPNAHERPPVR
jgi:hypothetical protein